MFNNHMGWLQKYKNMEFLSNIKFSRLEEFFLNGSKPMNHFTSKFYFVNQIWKMCFDYDYFTSNEFWIIIANLI
jgi:hypothetical protein